MKKRTCLFAILVFSITLFAQTVSANQADQVRFSLTVWDQSLEEVLSDIEQITGLTLLVDSDINSVPLTGVYNDVTVCEFFFYAVKEKTISISVHSEQNMMTISKIRPSQNSHGDSLACEIDYNTQAQHSVDMPLQQEEFLASEREEPPQAQQPVDLPSDHKMRDLETDQTDFLTGIPWSEAEDRLRLSSHAGKSSQLEQEEFLASEADHIIKAKQSVKAPTKKERDALFNDPLTGKPWFEIEPEARLSQKQERANKKLSEAEFLAAESGYIEKAKMAIENIQERSPALENIDPISGKNWDEVESQL